MFLCLDVVIIGDLPPPVYAHAMTLDAESGALYVVGGWAGAARCSVTRVTLPPDLCRLWSAGKHTCRHHMGCSFCTVYPLGGHNSTHCHSIGHAEQCSSHNGTLITNNGAACDATLVASRSCSNFTTCGACLALWPAHPESESTCQWCSAGGKGYKHKFFFSFFHAPFFFPVLIEFFFLFQEPAFPVVKTVQIVSNVIPLCLLS